VQQHCAERDGDTELAVTLKAQSDAAQAAWAAEFRKRFSAPSAPGNETLSVIAAKVRRLITENDPDAIRVGLAEIADALDQIGRGG
jgi:predicted NBD/HSP70 family sugar kinase